MYGQAGKMLYLSEVHGVDIDPVMTNPKPPMNLYSQSTIDLVAQIHQPEGTVTDLDQWLVDVTESVLSDIDSKYERQGTRDRMRSRLIVDDQLSTARLDELVSYTKTMGVPELDLAATRELVDSAMEGRRS